MARFWRDDSALTASFFATTATAYADRADIDELKSIAAASSEPARYSLHSSAASMLHSMVILQPFGTYAQPRKHRTKAKIFHIVDGEMVIVVFSEDGDIVAVHHMANDRVVVMHIAPDCYHTNVALTPQAIYHEVITGPFERDSTDRVFAPFAPVQEESQRGMEYLREAIGSVRADLGPF